MFTKTLRKLLPAVVLSCVAYNAQAAAVTYELTISGGLAGSGSFKGSDSDVDGFLRMNELSAFTFVLPGVFDATLPNLTAFGSYKISDNQWFADADADPLFGGGAYFSFYAVDLGEFQSVHPDNTIFIATTAEAEQGNSVPEPASLTLFGLGLAAAGLVRRRKQEGFQ